MILENIFFREIQLQNGDRDELIDKCWYAFEIDQAYPEEEIGNNAFLDWARDLTWIQAEYVIIAVKGPLKQDAKRVLEMISECWDRRLKNGTKPAYRKKVDFIIAYE